jgi:hypothetical protein
LEVAYNGFTNHDSLHHVLAEFVENVQAAMDSQQLQLNHILEAVSSSPPALSSSIEPFFQASASRTRPSKKLSQMPTEEVSASPSFPAFEGARVTWGCNKLKTGRRKIAQSKGGCLVPSSGASGASMKDMQSCGKH